MPHATTTRAFSHDDTGYLADHVILDMADNQFADWEAVDLVREATADEVARAQAPAELPVIAVSDTAPAD